MREELRKTKSGKTTRKDFKTWQTYKQLTLQH